MNMVLFDKPLYRLYILIAACSLSMAAQAQVANLDAIPLFTRSNVGGTARTAGTGGAFSSVGADMGCMELNPAGLGLYRSSDISVSPGIRVAADGSNYDGTNQSTTHTILQFAQAGAMLTKKMPDHSKGGSSNPFALKFITVGINFETENSFDRNQTFGLTNTNHSMIDNYAAISNHYHSDQWSLESYIFSLAGIQGFNAGNYSSNVKAPVLQAGTLNTRGAINKISLGVGGNLGDKLYFGFSLGVQLLNYTVSTSMSETNASSTDTVTHFQTYSLSSTVQESGIGVTGKLGLIYKPVPWMRFGVAYSLPTWYFMTENYSADLVYSFDSIPLTEIGPGSTDPVSYRIRTPMKGTVGASFYLKDHGFLSIDYDFQNLGSSHYTFMDSAAGLTGAFNSYLKSTYGYSHTVRLGVEGAIKKLRLRAGYSYTNSPFKKGQNYADAGYDASIHSATAGLGLKFKSFYVDLAYVFTYSKDGVSPNYVVALDPINSRYMTHNILLTLGFKIPTKGGNSNSNSPSRSNKRNNGELPKYIDPGDKPY